MRRIHKLTTAREAELVEWFHARFGNRIAKPVLATAREDGLVELILEHAEGIAPLEKIRSRQYFYDDLSRAVKLLAEMHAKGMDSPLLEDILGTDRAYFTNRIRTVLIEGVERYNNIELDEAAKNALAANWHIIEARLRETHLTAYNDSNLRNLHFTLACPVRFDIEYLKLLPAQLDLVNLLEFECEYLSERQRRALIEEYLRTAEQMTRGKIDRKSFLQDYEFAAVQRHLELTGYRARDAKGTDIPQLRAQLYHLRKAQSHIDDILSGGELNGEEQAALRNIQAALNRTNVLPEELSYLQNEVQPKYIVEPTSQRDKFKLAVSALMLVTATTLGLGYTAFENRNIPLANKYLFAGTNMVVVGWEKQAIGSKTTNRYHLYALTENGQLEWLISDIDHNSIVWSKDRSKVAFLHYSGQDNPEQWMQFDFGTGEKNIIEGKSRQPEGFSPTINPGDAVELTKGVFEQNRLKAYLSDGTLTIEYAGRIWQQPEVTNPDWISCMMKNRKFYCGLEKDGVGNLYTSNSDGSNFRRITSNTDTKTFFFFR